MVQTKNVARTGNTLVDSVSFIYAWDATELAYGFKQSDFDGNGVNDFDEGSWKPFYKSIFDNISSFTKLGFRETDYDSALLTQILTSGGGGQSSNPAPGVERTDTQIGIIGTSAGASGAVFLGQFSETWFHEIGHSLGLRHSFEVPDLIDDNVRGENDLGDHFLNSSLYSVMSYSPFVWGEDNPWTPGQDVGGTVVRASVGSFMPIDIAALQNMYGVRAANTGNTVYSFGDDLVANKGYTTIWDTGGTDTIVYAGNSRAKIDLRAATLEKEIGGGGFLSTSETLTGGFLIAHNATIENARGGGNDDLLIGNAADNLLSGHDGADVLRGLGGRDILVGGAGGDVLAGGSGGDRLTGGAGADVFLFGAGSGRDGITDFGADDVLVTSRQIWDSNRDGIINFGRDGVNLGGGGSVMINNTAGQRVTALEYDGSYEQNGETMFVYSLYGSAAGLATAGEYDLFGI